MRVSCRELERKIDILKTQTYANQLDIYNKILNQKRTDKNKIYSLHEPQVKCYTKGKEHKKFEFGSKAAILMTQTTGVIVGAEVLIKISMTQKLYQP